MIYLTPDTAYLIEDYGFSEFLASTRVRTRVCAYLWKLIGSNQRAGKVVSSVVRAII